MTHTRSPECLWRFLDVSSAIADLSSSPRPSFAVHSAPVALREGILSVRVLQPALHYEPEQIAKSEILRKLKQRFGGKTNRDIRFRFG
jgi:hypothetical protein